MDKNLDSTMGKQPNGPERLKEEFENLVRSAETLSRTLKMRADERFNHLLSQEALTLLHATCAQAARMLGEQSLNLDASTLALFKRFGDALEEIGNAPRESRVRDSVESLETVRRNLQRPNESISAIGVALSKHEEEFAKEHVRLIGNLETTLSAKIRWVGRKIQALQAISDVRF